MIVLDTSVLVAGLTSGGPARADLRAAIERGERIVLPALVLCEWLRGPRRLEELAAQEALFPSPEALPFGPEEAALAADLYGRARRARGRELDLAIAASAIVRDAALWTLNRTDFEDVEDLRLWRP